MSQDTGPQSFGRVDDDGTVYVRTSSGERSVGQVPDASPSEAMEFFVRRFTSLQTEVELLESRVSSGSVAPAEAQRTAARLSTSIEQANAVGDLEGLKARVDALAPTIEAKAEVRREERAAAHAETKAAKERMVAQAEEILHSNDWRGGVGRFRKLLEEWKQLPRIDRKTSTLR